MSTCNKLESPEQRTSSEGVSWFSQLTWKDSAVVGGTFCFCLNKRAKGRGKRRIIYSFAALAFPPAWVDLLIGTAAGSFTDIQTSISRPHHGLGTSSSLGSFWVSSTSLGLVRHPALETDQQLVVASPVRGSHCEWIPTAEVLNLRDTVASSALR